jgi:ribose 5-phosphate isomerase B
MRISEEVRLTRAHNNANVLTLGARFTDSATARELLRVFLETPFKDSDNDGGRPARRVSKIARLKDQL